MAQPQVLQDDPNLVLPKAVRDAAERSSQMVAHLNAQQEQTGEPEVTSEGNPPELDPLALAAPAAEAPEVPTPQPETDPAPEPVEDEAKWEHKYKSLHGRYLRQEQTIKELTDNIQNLQNVIAAMSAQQVQPGPSFTVEKLVTPDEENDYGPDLLNVMGKKAKEELIPIIAEQAKRIEQLTAAVQGIASSRAVDTQKSMHQLLDEHVPNWTQINTSDEFHAWLRLPDVFSGAIRHDMLKQAYAQGDANRVLAFFRGFLADEAATTPVQVVEPDPTVTTVPKVPLASLAAPGKAKTTAASTGAPAEKPIITRAQVTQFYADVAAGKYRGRDAEKQALEVMIFQAGNEGRIR